MTGVVANAGGAPSRQRLEDMSDARIDEVIALNLRAALLCSREAVHRMSTRYGGAGGVLVHVTSRAAVLVPCPSYPWPSQAAFEQARRGRLWVTRPDPTSGRVVHYERRMVSRQTTLQRGYGHAGLVP